jgi:TRAP-type C4-dicarboxylate transport system permease large subunit
MGKYRGGAAKIAVTASSIFGSISGSAVSNVISTGVITIPLMEQGGYRRHHAGAIEAVTAILAAPPRYLPISADDISVKTFLLNNPHDQSE